MSVTIGDIVFEVSGGTSQERDQVNAILETFKEFPQMVEAFTGTDTELGTNPVNIIIGGTIPENYYGGYIEFVTDGLSNKVESATISLDLNQIDYLKFLSEGGSSYVQNTVAATLANELGDLAARANPDFKSGESIELFGQDAPPNQEVQSAFDRASIRLENMAREAYGLPARNVNSENDFSLLGDGGIDDISIFPSVADNLKAIAVAKNLWLDGGRITISPDSSAPTGTPEDFADWLKNANESLDGIGNLPTPETIWDVEDLFETADSRGSPILFDLDGDGIELSALSTTNTTFFDLDGDGFAERTGWVSADDAILVYDDGDGRIEGTSEWFGTMLTDGFTIASEYDSNDDDKLSAEDLIWSSLQLWRDLDQDGISDAGELFALTDYDIISLNLNASVSGTTNQGHLVSHTSTYTYDTGSGTATRAANDIWFNFENVSSRYAQDYTFDMRAAYLASVRGYGVLADLHIAMSLDNTGTGNLLDLVTNLNDLTFAQLFDGTTGINDDIRDILFRWAGSDGLGSGARGVNADARELAFLEAIMGQDFLQAGHEPNPLYDAGVDLRNAFDLAFNHVYARLLAQSAGGDLFNGDFFYNIATDSFEGITGLNLTTLGTLETEATGLANTAARQTFWENVVRMVEYSVGTANLSGGDLLALQTAITDSDSTLDLEDDILPAMGGDTAAYGGVDDDTINGTTGADSLGGGAGYDYIDGLGGNDTLTGGTGDDFLKGGQGNDTYVYAVGDGTDVISEYAQNGTDVIQFGAGIDSGDLTMTRVGDYDLKIAIDTGTSTGTIMVDRMFWSDAGVETIDFAADTDITFSALHWTLNGTSAGEILYGVQYGGGANDTINGLGGNDTLHGYDGTNTLNGGDGTDTVYGGTGVDTMDGGAGNDRLYGYGNNDILTGGAGDDYVDGGLGDDTYNYLSGHDTYVETGGTDSIVLDSAYTQANTVYYKIGNDMKIVFGTDGLNDILLKSWYVSGAAIETLDFATGTDATLSGVTVVVQGDENNNTLNGTTGANVLYGMGGNDTINGDSGNDTLYGGTGNDTIQGGYGDDIVDGGAGDDTLNETDGADNYVYVSGNDTISDGGGNDTDVITLTGGWETSDLTLKRYNASPYTLKIEIDATNSISISNQFYSSAYSVESITDGTNTITFASASINTYGTTGNDSISGITAGASTNDILYGLAGNDTLSAGAGNDTLYGGTGTDTLYGYSGNDIYVYESGDGDDTVDEQGQGGTDEIRFGSGIDINDLTFSRVGYGFYNLKIDVAGGGSLTVTNQFYSSGYGVETVRFADNSTVNLTTMVYTSVGTSSGESINGITVGGSTDDIMYGYGGADTFYGGSGNDTLYGGDGNDTVYGEAGNDTMNGEAGNDNVFGGAGDDVYVFTGGLDRFDENVGSPSGTDTIRMTGTTTINDITVANLSSADAKITVASGTDEISVWLLRHANTTYHIERIEFADGFNTSLPDYNSWTWGTSGADSLTGTGSDETIIGKDGSDTIDGAGGADDIHGGVGNDSLTGGAGTDLLHGGVGNDTLYGGDGLDTLYGGAGADTFVFEAASAYNQVDTIKDFSTGDNDVIDLTDLLGAYDPMTDAITDFVSITTSGSDSSLFVNPDGLGFHQIGIIAGVTGLTDEAALVTSGHLLVA